MNISESAGVDKSTTVGAMLNTSVGVDYMTNVLGKMTVYVKGNHESHTEQDRKVTSLKGIETNSEKAINHHAKTEIQNNSGEKSKSH